MNRITWAGSDKDRFFGPFTISNDASYPQWGAVVTSADDEDRPASARIHLNKQTILFPLPGWLIKPYREQVKFTHLSDEERQRMGRDWYWQIDERAYGFTVAEGALHVKLGRQTHDSWTDRSKCYFFPWREWRVVRNDIYDDKGQFFASLHGKDWKVRHPLQGACPRVSFLFRDFDGEEITASCYIQEWDRKLGAGRFKWLSLFRRKDTRRSLDIRFSSEVGKRKVSWKGGTIGHSIEMRPGELHEAAFRRYCQEQGLTFIGPDTDSERGQADE